MNKNKNSMEEVSLWLMIEVLDHSSLQSMIEAELVVNLWLMIQEGAISFRLIIDLMQVVILWLMIAEDLIILDLTSDQLVNNSFKLD